MKNQRGFIQIPLLVAIIAGVLVVGGGGYLGIKQYKNYQAEKTEKEKLSQEKEKQTQEQQKALESTQAEIEKLKKESIDAQRKQTILEKKITTTKNLSLIIKEWRPRVARLTCVWRPSSGNNITITGTGFLDIKGSILTNEHVMVINTGTKKVNASVCYVTFPDNPKVYENNRSYDVIWGGDVDVGSIFINADATLDEIASKEVNWCNNKASIGDEVVILGYPTIGGSENEITATEGIISGYDGNYYVTSAKIDKGNSGGAAILVKNNCYLGIPTQAAIGSIESLGRILRFGN